MESASYHIIQQQVFDVYTKRKDRYALLQNRFSRLFNNELFPLLETFIDREIPANFNFRIETMTVDLGTVRYEYLEQDITRIFIECFKKALHEITGDVSVSPALPVTAEVTNDQTDRRLEIMEFFLFTGTLPWWAATGNYRDPLTITDELLLHKKYEFRELLYRTGDNETVRKRLALQFPESYIRSVVKILEPDKAGFIFQYHNEVTALQEDQQFVQSEAKEFEKAIWLFILDYLLVDRGSIFEERSFVKSSLYKMSMFFNVQYEELLVAFYKAVQMVPPSLKRSGGLGLIIEYVYNDHFFKQEQDEKGTDTAGSATDEEMQLLNQLRWLEYFLDHGGAWGLQPVGEGPTLAEPVLITRELLVRWLNGLIEKMPSIFTAKLSEWVRQQPVRQKRLFQILDAELLKKITAILAEQHGPVVNRYFDLLRLMYKEGGAINCSIADNTFIYQSAFTGIMLLKQDNISITAFIKTHLQTVSAHYNIDAEKLAKALLQAIVQEHGKNDQNTELLAGITALLKSEEKASLELWHTYPGRAAGVGHTYSVANGVWHASDAAGSSEWLTFYIHNGFLPWWAPAVDAQRMVEYINEFTSKEPEKAQAVFISSLKSYAERRRLMVLFSPAQLTGLFKNLPGVRDGVRAYEELLVIVKKSFTADHITVDKAEKLMMLLLLEEYGTAGEAFDVSRFVLACQVQFNLVKVQDQVMYFTGTAPGEWQRSIDELTDETETISEAILPIFIKETELPAKTIELLKQFANRYADTHGSDVSARDLLTKLLTAGVLPDEVKGISDNEKYHLVRSLLLTAYRKDVAGVQELLRLLPIASVGFTTLYRLFSKATTIEERSIFYLIRTAAEKKLLHWWQQAGVNIETAAVNNLQKVIHAVMMHERGDTFTRLLQTDPFRNWLLPVSLPYISDESVDRLLEIMLPAATGHLNIFIKEFRVLLQQTKMLTVDNTALVKLYRLFLFDLLSGKINANDPLALVKAFFDLGERVERPLMFRLYASLSGHSVAEAEKQSRRSFLWPRLKQEIIQRIELHARKFSQPGKGAITGHKDQSSDALLLLQIKNELKKKQKEEEEKQHPPKYPALREPEVEKIYVPNAGLVLLYPFYATFFGRLGLLDQGKFIDPRTHQRAVHLMAFIADGKEEHAEHTLPLSKILCGFPVKEPVDHAFSIQENEKELTVQMLNVVFQRWQKLKNSTVEGFRESFLKRQGILTRTGEGWNLRVEQRGYDILLDTMPWGFRFIRSSWMDTILTVEWI